ncbi:MAG: ATP-grasp fold amidoligase family protein [Terracidiphilus sp.]
MLKPVWAVFRDALPAKAHVALDHLRNHRKLPNLQHPATFSEKIAYRKLYDRDPRIPCLVDKITAKQQMAARFGEDFIIPTLATFDTAAEIDFAALPYPCVVKPNHASGFNVFLRERPAKEGEMRRRLGRLLQYRHERASEEWAYSQIAPRLLVEPWLVETLVDSEVEGGRHDLIDYKFHTFGGRVFSIQVDVDRYTNHRRCFFDPSWTPMQFELLYQRAGYEIPAPVALKDMLRYAGQIGEGFAYVRVDLYEVAGKVKFGEVTFYPGAGLEVFNPQEFDALFGVLWD